MWRRLGLDSLWLLLARLAAQGCALGFAALAARRLGVAGFGQLTALTVWVFVANVATTFGTDTLLVRNLARAGALTAQFSAALWVQLGLSAIWWAGLVVLSGGHLALSLYGLALFPLAAYSVFSAALRAFGRMGAFAWLGLASALWPWPGVWLVVRAESDVVRLCGWLLIGHVLLALIAAGLLRPRPARWLASRAEVKAVLRAAWPLAALSLTAILAQRLGVLALSLLAGDADTGVYGAAARLVEGVKLGHYAVLGALLPVLARPGPRPSFRPVWVGLLALSLAPAAGLVLFAQPLVAVVYGSRFAATSRVVGVLAWSLPPYALNASLSLRQVAQGGERTVLAVTLGGVLTLAALCALWAPRFGPVGVAWAAVAAECVQAGVLLAWVRIDVLRGRAASRQVRAILSTDGTD